MASHMEEDHLSVANSINAEQADEENEGGTSSQKSQDGFNNDEYYKGEEENDEGGEDSEDVEDGDQQHEDRDEDKEADGEVEEEGDEKIEGDEEADGEVERDEEADGKVEGDEEAEDEQNANRDPDDETDEDVHKKDNINIHRKYIEENNGRGPKDSMHFQTNMQQLQSKNKQNNTDYTLKRNRDDELIHDLQHHETTHLDKRPKLFLGNNMSNPDDMDQYGFNGKDSQLKNDTDSNTAHNLKLDPSKPTANEAKDPVPTKQDESEGVEDRNLQKQKLSSNMALAAAAAARMSSFSRAPKPNGNTVSTIPAKPDFDKTQVISTSDPNHGPGSVKDKDDENDSIHSLRADQDFRNPKIEIKKNSNNDGALNYQSTTNQNHFNSVTRDKSRENQIITTNTHGNNNRNFANNKTNNRNNQYNGNTGFASSAAQKQQVAPQNNRQGRSISQSTIMTMVGIGQCTRRIFSFNEDQRKRPSDPAEKDTFWKNFVNEYFEPGSKMLLDIGQKDVIGAIPQSVEIPCLVMPRLFKIKYDSGVKEERLCMENPVEFLLENGVVVVDCPSADLITIFEKSKVLTEGHLRVSFSSALRILCWEFSCYNHEELINRELKQIPPPSTNKIGLTTPVVRAIQIIEAINQTQSKYDALFEKYSRDTEEKSS